MIFGLSLMFTGIIIVVCGAIRRVAEKRDDTVLAEIEQISLDEF